MNRDRFNLFFRKKCIGFLKHGLGDVGFGTVIDSAKVNTCYFDQERSCLGVLKQQRSIVITTNHFILNVYNFLLQFEKLISMMKLSHNYMWRETNSRSQQRKFAPLITPNVNLETIKWKNIKRRSLWLLESTINHRIWLLTGNFCKKVTLFDNCINFLIGRGLAMCVYVNTNVFVYLSEMAYRVISGHLRIHVFKFTEAFSFKESLV